MSERRQKKEKKIENQHWLGIICTVRKLSFKTLKSHAESYALPFTATSNGSTFTTIIKG